MNHREIQIFNFVNERHSKISLVRIKMGWKNLLDSLVRLVDRKKLSELMRRL
ncbi:MAG: hypothetical protein YK1309IOTA_70002 [Marine Group I thaumarchaeote]|nr:MAG: hypothetical protein YK1309IOTA_70002 [Marine Group I thaumarchaeote]